MPRRLTALWFLLAVSCRLLAAEPAEEIAALIAPANLAVLKGDTVLERLPMAVYFLETARRDSRQPLEVATRATQLAGYKGAAAKATSDHLLLCLAMVERLGCLDEAGMAELKRGGAPFIRKGPDAGDRLGVDQIISPIFCPEVGAVVCNWELTPLRAAVDRAPRVGPKQRALAADLQIAGLITKEGYNSILAARVPSSPSAGAGMLPLSVAVN